MNELIVLPNPPDTNVGPTGPGPDAPEKARLKRQSWRRFGAAACALALTLGTGWAVGNKFQPREAADSRGDTNAARKLADANEAERGDIRALREEIRALQAKLDSLDKRSDAPERGTLEAQLNSLDRKIEANHADAANVAAQIEARLEKNDKSMGRLEAAISAKSSVPSTASNDAKASVKPAAKVAAPSPGFGRDGRRRERQSRRRREADRRLYGARGPGRHSARAGPRRRALRSGSRRPAAGRGQSAGGRKNRPKMGCRHRKRPDRRASPCSPTPLLPAARSGRLLFRRTLSSQRWTTSPLSAIFPA